LAIVHALAYLSKQQNACPVYSDSQTAIVWVRGQKVASRSMAKGQTSEAVNRLVHRALAWLGTHDYPNPILKWRTEAWGEIPADFGRK
jgi:ribonuclease HI